MVFNSVPYALFLPVVLGAYWLLRRKGQNALLLVASYVFYGWWDYRFLVFMWFSTITDYTVGRLLAATEDERRRKRIFAVSLIVNLGILGVFKYFNFFVNSAADVLRAFGLHPDFPTLKLLLPVGISFYTFHGISYTFDVYRRDIEPAKNPLDFACFIAYFPQLVAGPIGRAQIQLPQFANDRRRPSRDDVRSGLFLILLGLFKKVAIADVLAPFVQQAFHNPGTSSWQTLLMGFYGFGLQVYGDFSGYSDIARGSSRLFGIELLRNFEQPFLSRNMTALWRTWHISLSTWLRDYVYVPLGGSRVSKRRIYINTMILMLVAGLWHGAAWTFVSWGAINGVYLIVERVIADRRARTKGEESTPIGGPMGTLPIDVRHETAVEASAVKTSRRTEAPLPPPFGWGDVLPAFRTFTLFCLATLFFRAESFHGARLFLTGLLTLRGGVYNPNAVVLMIFAAIFSFGFDVIQRNSRDETPVIEWTMPARAAVYATFIVAVVLFSGNTPTPFFYFQF
jgi:D-alanyl-lipoteichoic acid acyltransferase DltB (MBOAT superfamily)